MAKLEDPLKTQICLLWIQFEHQMASLEADSQVRKIERDINLFI